MSLFPQEIQAALKPSAPLVSAVTETAVLFQDETELNQMQTIFVLMFLHWNNSELAEVCSSLS